MSEQEHTLAANTILDDRYRIISRRASNDLGTTYWAHDLEEDSQVSLLVLARRWGGGPVALEYLQRVQPRYRSLDAPGLIPVEDMGLIGEQVYLVRGPAQDPTLADLLVQQGRIDASLAVWIAIHVCEALAPAHHQGLVHGGLCTQSVQVGPSAGLGPDSGSAVRLLDAGLLPALRAASATKDGPWGRPPYFSPEQVAGVQVHPPSDIYVIGSLLYEMLAGRPPFRSTDDAVLAANHLRQAPPNLQVLVPDLPPLLVEIVHRTLAKEPAARYRNAGQLAQILRTQIAAKLPSPKPAAVPSAAVPPFAEVQEHLVVPPPPAPTVSSTWLSGNQYQIEDESIWSEESTGVDWTTVALFILALIAVLGLIPLWRAVYRRYASPPPFLAPGAYYFEWEIPLVLQAALTTLDETLEQTELGTYDLVWYNVVSGNRGPDQVSWLGDKPRFCRKCAIDHPIWESSLRVSKPRCSTLAAQV